MLVVGIGVALLVVLLAVVAATWGARGARAQRGALEGVARGIAQLRRMAGVTPRYVPLPGDAQEVPGLERAEPELERSGLVPVGDVHELGEDGRPAAAVRWFVSRQGGVWGWLGLSPAGPAMLLVSQVPGAGFVTTLRSPPAPNTAIPDTVVHKRLDWEEGLAAALGRHATAVAAMGEPRPVAGLEGALEGMAAEGPCGRVAHGPGPGRAPPRRREEDPGRQVRGPGRGDGDAGADGGGDGGAPCV